MPTLENDQLVFRFPGIDARTPFTIALRRQRRFRDPVNPQLLSSQMPPLPLRSVEPYAHRLPDGVASTGGFIVPLRQSETLGLSFWHHASHGVNRLPMAIKVTAANLNPIGGDISQVGLSQNPLNYFEVPGETSLEGFALAPSRLFFLANPLTDDVSRAERFNAMNAFDTLRISVIPLSAKAWLAAQIPSREEIERQEMERKRIEAGGAHGLLRKIIRARPFVAGTSVATLYYKPFHLGDWAVEQAEHVVISIVPAKNWTAITGSKP